MLSRLILIAIFIPLAIVMIILAVANRAVVPFTLDPFNPGSEGLTIALPLFVYLFVALIAGAIIGSMATWFKQGRYRKLAREYRQENKSTIRERPAAGSRALVREQA